MDEFGDLEHDYLKEYAYICNEKMQEEWRQWEEEVNKPCITVKKDSFLNYDIQYRTPHYKGNSKERIHTRDDISLKDVKR